MFTWFLKAEQVDWLKNNLKGYNQCMGGDDIVTIYVRDDYMHIPPRMELFFFEIENNALKFSLNYCSVFIDGRIEWGRPEMFQMIGVTQELSSTQEPSSYELECCFDRLKNIVDKRC